ncbi:MAG TPA: dihydropteroate synthase, partial [Acidobacteriaceae bacterium]|nr:dihydropteroate synthase [Acidobacteriaceae bacterium]
VCAGVCAAICAQAGIAQAKSIAAAPAIEPALRLNLIRRSLYRLTIGTMPFVRKSHSWKLRTRELALGGRTLVMGVLNVTPDSFSDGGQYLAPEKAIAHALKMLEEGADILDIGGESTRPGKRAPLTPEAEQERVLGVIEGILAAQPEAVISIDTFHAETARAAVATGAEIVNDVSGFLWDAGMAAACAELGCGVVLMHARGKPAEWASLPPLAANEVVPLVKRELAERAEAALVAGVARERIVLDPGFGFGKIGDENYALLAGFSELQELGFPLLAGASRKSFLLRALAECNSKEPGAKARLYATIAAHTAAIVSGASVVRVHDVRAAVEAAAIADAILRG